MENEQKPSEQQTNKKLTNSEQNTDQAEASGGRTFQLSDLPRLTFVLEGVMHDVWSSSAEEFQMYVQQFGTAENVDVAIWSVFDRLDYVNSLFTFCQENDFQFPFVVKPVEHSQEVSA